MRVGVHEAIHVVGLMSQQHELGDTKRRHTLRCDRRYVKLG